MRVMPNGSRSEVLLTVFQPSNMPEKNFREDIKMVEKDLKSLKIIMEKNKRF